MRASTTWATFCSFFDHLKIDVMILGLAPHAEPSRLDSWKYNSYKFSEASWIQWRYSFISTACGVIREDSVSRNRVGTLSTNSTQPNEVNYHRSNTHMASSLTISWQRSVLSFLTWAPSPLARPSQLHLSNSCAYSPDRGVSVPGR